MGTGDNSPTTELDSHANMVVVGKHSTIVARTGRSAEVQAFSNECNSLEEIPIVDAAIAYDCTATGKTFILIVKNALYIPTMDRNLIPPFIMREAGLVVNDVPRIHCGEELTNDSHCIISKDVDMRIPLKLRGIFSCFDSRALTSDEANNCDELDMVMLTPDSSEWDPYSEVYSDNERQYVDWNGNVMEPIHIPKRQKLIVDDDHGEVFTLQVSGERWERAMDDAVEHTDFHSPQDDTSSTAFNMDQDDPIRAQVADLSAVLDPDLLHDLLSNHVVQSKAAMAAGCSGISDLQRDYDDDLFISLEVAAAHVEVQKGVTKEMLASVWRISEDEARRTLEVTTQLNRQSPDSSLSRRAGTNDRMLRYKRLNSMFFTDTFFVTKEAKSVRGFGMMQIFVSDKGFVKVYGMKSLREIPAAVKRLVRRMLLFVIHREIRSHKRCEIFAIRLDLLFEFWRRAHRLATELSCTLVF